MTIDNQTLYSTEDLRALFADCIRRLQKEGFPNSKVAFRSAGLSVTVQYGTGGTFANHTTIRLARQIAIRLRKPTFLSPERRGQIGLDIGLEFLEAASHLLANRPLLPARIHAGLETAAVRYVERPVRGSGEWLRQKINDALSGKRAVEFQREVVRCEKNLRKAQTRAKLASTLLKNRTKDLKYAKRRLEQERAKVAELFAHSCNSLRATRSE